MSRGKQLISIAILLVIALHAIPIVYAPERKTLWPILEWSMYKDSRPAGPIRASRRRLTAITSSGAREEVTARLLGSSGYAFRSLYLQPMGAGDSAVARDLLARLNRTRADSVLELRLDLETFAVTDTGVVKQSDSVVSYHRDLSHSR